MTHVSYPQLSQETFESFVYELSSVVGHHRVWEIVPTYDIFLEEALELLGSDCCQHLDLNLT